MPLRPLLGPSIKFGSCMRWGDWGEPRCAADHQHTLPSVLAVLTLTASNRTGAFVKPPALDGRSAALRRRKTRRHPLPVTDTSNPDRWLLFAMRLPFSARSIKPNALVSSALVGIREPAENHRLVYGWSPLSSQCVPILDGLQTSILGLFVVERRHMRKNDARCRNRTGGAGDRATTPRSADTLEPSCKSPRVLDVVIGAPSDHFDAPGIEWADRARRRSDDQRIVWERFAFGDE